MVQLLLLMGVYGYMLFLAAALIGDGSELLLLVRRQGSACPRLRACARACVRRAAPRRRQHPRHTFARGLASDSTNS